MLEWTDVCAPFGFTVRTCDNDYEGVNDPLVDKLERGKRSKEIRELRSTTGHVANGSSLQKISFPERHSKRTATLPERIS